MKKFIEDSQASINKKDLELLFNLLADFKPQTVLEVGAWKGCSARMWYQAFSPKKLVTIESEGGVFEEDDSLKDKIKVLDGWDSHDGETLDMVKRIVSPDQVDFLFIDGDHSYEGVKKDFEIYSPLVKEEGVIVFHDVVYTSDDPLAPVQVKKLWQEIRDSYTWVEIKSKDSTGMGVLFI